MGGAGGSLNVSANSAAISAPLSGTIDGTRSRSSSVGASGSLSTGLAAVAAAAAEVASLARAPQALMRRFRSRRAISGRVAWLRTPPTTIAHSLQSGFLAPKGYTRQSSQYSSPHRRQTFSADSKLWSSQSPVIS